MPRRTQSALPAHAGAPRGPGAGPVLVTAEGRRVLPLDLHAGTFIDKTTTLYGPSKTGKTVLIKHAMSVLNGPIEQVVIVAPTAVSNRAYDGFIEPPCLHYSLRLPEPPPDPSAPPSRGKKKAETEAEAALRFVETIWQRQEMMASIYTRANDPKTLAHLYGRLSSAARREGDEVMRNLERRRERVVAEVETQYRSDPGRCVEKRREVNEKFTKMLVLMYKQHIEPHLGDLWDRRDLSEDERYSLNYLHFNPRLLLIFDDCAAQLKPVFSKDIFRKLWYQNRHVFITVLIACQDDTDLPANLRKNNYISFFTEPIVATSNFERSANKFPKTTQRTAADVIDTVFQAPNRKLAYIREDERGEHFYSVQVPYPKPQVFGSPALRELCRQIKAERVAMDSSNPFFSSFKLDDVPTLKAGARA